jgi:acetyl esterase
MQIISPIIFSYDYESESDELLPVLVYYHGGGTVLLSPEDYTRTITALAAEADCIVIAPDYHLAPENPFPEPLEECHTVLNWTLENAQTIGGDPNRVAIAGDSGGGYLTAAVCLEAKLKNTPQPIYQVIIYPMVDNAGKTASYTEMDYFINE